MAGIFVSYRRSDTKGTAGALVRELNDRFGDEQIFMDIEDIDPGRDFVQVLDGALGSTDVLIALIGPRWLSEVDGEGKRRLDNPGDFVRKELATALAGGIRVIPVLVEGAPMPAATDLPEDLQPLAVRNAMQISNVRWDYDVEQISTAVGSVIGKAPVRATASPPTGGSKIVKLLGAVFTGVGLLLLGIALFSWLNTRGFIARSVETEGTVVEVVEVEGERETDDGQRVRSVTYHPIIEFETDERGPVRFRASGSNPPSDMVGDKVDVIYDPQRPIDAKKKSFFDLWFLSFFLGLLGALFFLLGIAPFVWRLLRGRKRRRLLDRGKAVATELRGVAIDNSLTVNGQHPYRVTTEWKDPETGRALIFRSEPVWSDPSQYLLGKSITVIVDPQDHGSYMMDLSFLPRDV